MINCSVYIACAMSGRDKAEMVARAQRVCDIFREAGLNPISPVLEEKVKNEPGKLINSDKEQLKQFWKRDKEIIIKEAHVFFWDHAEMKSFGAEREYALARFCLWKPAIMYVAPGTPVSVAGWEDDAIVTSVHEAAKFIAENYGTAKQRRIWRFNMLKRTWKTWLVRQYLAWR